MRCLLSKVILFKRKSARVCNYFECKVVSIFICNNNRRCLLSKVILFKRKSARVCNYFECKVVSMFVCNGSGAVFATNARV